MGAADLRSSSSWVGRCWRPACSPARWRGRSSIFLIVACWERWRVGGYFWNVLGLEYTLMWTIAALYFLVHGGGMFSLDHLIGRAL